MDGALVNLGIVEHLLHWGQSRPQQIGAQLFKPSPGDGRVQINAIIQRINLHRGLSRRRQSTLGTLASSAQPPQRPGIASQILLVLALEFLHKVVHQSVVKIFATQVSVTSRSLDLKDALVNGQQRHIERTTTQIKDEHILFTTGASLVQPVGNGSGGGLIDDAQHLQTSNGTGILGGLTLRVIKVGGHSDHGLLHLMAQVGLGSLPHLGQHHGRDLFGLELLGLALVFNRHVGLARLVHNLEWPVLHVRLHGRIIIAPANQPLGIKDGVGGIHGSLILGSISNQTLTVREANIGWGGPVALIIGNDLHTIILPHTNARIGGTQINSDSNSFSSHYDINIT
mmetsp:Transcript_67676/g.94101  ORF Transcript_67676/g.94101 Transcript_67676/m.94101 type:complete len:341 (-) Transcript_67676:56-1078(-)